MVTGAAQGLGLAIADRLAGRGLRVLVTDIDGHLAAEAAARIGRGAASRPLDVRDPVALRATAAEAAATGSLAVWVNNAGVVRAEPVLAHADATVDLLVATNLVGVVNGSRVAIEQMRVTGGGRVLNVASLSSLAPTPGLAVYSATKHGVLAFSVALQAEMRRAGVPVEIRSICPDGIKTDMVLRQQADDAATALSWSGIRLLGTDEVADRAIEVLYGGRLTASLPAWRGALARSLGLAPRAVVRAAPALERLGAWNRRRWKRGDLP